MAIVHFGTLHLSKFDPFSSSLLRQHSTVMIMNFLNTIFAVFVLLSRLHLWLGLGFIVALCMVWNFARSRIEVKLGIGLGLDFAT